MHVEWQPIVQLSFPFIIYNVIKHAYQSCSNMSIIIRVDGIYMKLKLPFSTCHKPRQLPFFDELLLLHSSYLRDGRRPGWLSDFCLLIFPDPLLSRARCIVLFATKPCHPFQSACTKDKG